jgi:hypothetical protein
MHVAFAVATAMEHEFGIAPKQRGPKKAHLIANYYQGMHEPCIDSLARLAPRSVDWGAQTCTIQCCNFLRRNLHSMAPLLYITRVLLLQ